MHHNTLAAGFAAAAFAVCSTPSASAADYFVASDGNDSSDGLSAETAFATIDKAVVTATSASDVIRVAPGTYPTTTQYGPNLVAKLVGEGESRDEVVIQSAGTYRTLRMAAGSWLENVTVVGIAFFTGNADNGGAIEMSGGTVTNCVIRDGHANYASARSGGNLFMASGLVVDCEIRGGEAKSRGGNIDIEGGTVRDCTISGGRATAWGGNVYVKGSSARLENCKIVDGANTDDSISNAFGGNVHIENAGTLADCEISGGTSFRDGGNVYVNGTATISGCTISGGSSVNGHGGNVRIVSGSGTLADCTISDGTCVSAADQIFGANLYVSSGATISRCRFSGGSIGSYNGGSVCLNNNGARFEDCLVEGCANGGVLLYTVSWLYNCTIAGNQGYGVWSWTATQHVFNTVVSGNNADEWNGNLPDSSSAEFSNCASSADSRLAKSSSLGEALVIVDNLSFADADGGDWHPAASSPLLDAGCSDPRGASASATDLDGNPRASGAVEISCYEAQKAEMTVRIVSAEKDRSFAPATVTFAHVADNSASPENVVFAYDFGDGSPAESTSDPEIAHVYAAPGVYTVTITATNDCDEEDAEMVCEGYVRVASSTVYVTPGNAAAAFPYDTPETGFATVKAAVAAAEDGYTILLGTGVHETLEQVYTTKALTFRGLGDSPEGTILRNVRTTPDSYFYRVLDVENASARLENFTLENGCVKNQNGGNLMLVGGVASNLVIRGGVAVVDGDEKDAAGAGAMLGKGATLTHCKIVGNTVNGTSYRGSYAGGAVAIGYGATDVRISNCLVADNRYVTSGETAKSGSAGIRFFGRNDNSSVENCTVAGNVVEGSVSDDSAGIYCTTWYGRLRNNIVAGNYETGKGACTSVKLDFTSDNNFTYHNNVTDGARIADSGSMSKNNVLVSAPAALFKNFAAGDYRPRAGSAAYDAGTLSGLYLEPSVDLAGQPRVFGTAIDAGCYESQFLAATVFLIR